MDSRHAAHPGHPARLRRPVHTSPSEIHESVLYIFAQILIYCGCIFGIDCYFSKRSREGEDK